MSTPENNGIQTVVVTDSYNAGNGDDVVVAATTSPVILTGGNGMDTLTGGDGDDRIDGGRGEDVIEGGAGDDILITGKGADTLVYTFSFVSGGGTETFGGHPDANGNGAVTPGEWGQFKDAYEAWLAGFGEFTYEHNKPDPLTALDGAEVDGPVSSVTLSPSGQTRYWEPTVALEGEPYLTSNDGFDKVLDFKIGEDHLRFDGIEDLTFDDFSAFFRVTNADFGSVVNTGSRSAEHLEFRDLADGRLDTKISIVHDGEEVWSVTLMGVNATVEDVWTQVLGNGLAVS